jgi:pimeloyl-ACP methyl ester carboxylesterase
MRASIVESKTMRLPLNGKSIEVSIYTLPSADNTILLLHEALGSVSYWKDFPHRLALATGSNVLVYSRPGHGNSEGPLEPRNEGHYLDQVEVVIPQLLRHFSVERPVIYGHSEGAGIAMLYAASSVNVKALILESPFVIAWKGGSQVIEKMAAEYPGSKLQNKLTQYHQDADAVFYSWVKWALNLGEGESPLPNVLSRIECPVLVLQGANDEFGSSRHLQAIKSELRDVQHEEFANTGHLPHREQTEPVLNRVAQFLADTNRFASSRDPIVSPTLCED